MFDKVYQVTEDRMTANWVASDLVKDNVEYTPTPGTDFVRIQVEWSGSNNISVGYRTRGVGLVYFHVCTTLGKGTKPATLLADAIKTLFGNQQVDGVEYLAPYIQRVGEQEEWYQINVLIPFKYDECN